MPLGLAVMLMVVIALSGAVALYYLDVNAKKKLAAAEQLRLDQENHVSAVYAQIENNLASIREHETMISRDLSGNIRESGLGPEERIQNEIDFISNLIAENNSLIDKLKTQIEAKDVKLLAVESQVKDLKKRIDSYQDQLDQLVAEKIAIQNDLDNSMMVNGKLENRVSQLNDELVLKDEIIDDQKVELVNKDNMLHTAYYTVGTYKNLHEQDILQKEGGFLGINKVTTLAGNPDIGHFHSIDTRDIKQIPVFAKKWEIVTGQDPSSYTFTSSEDGKVDWLTITNTEKFWGQSKYLVIVVRDNDYDELAISR